jgi:hypothetical protein
MQPINVTFDPAAADPGTPALVLRGNVAGAVPAAALLTGAKPTINNAATFTDLAAATTAYNNLLAALRTRGIIGGA